jgi:hypothetical protein
MEFRQSQPIANQFSNSRIGARLGADLFWNLD